jgi:CRISPR/Cas system-associated exonuclease Cas4 (RecB family)
VIKQYQDGTVLNNIELDKIIENNTHLPYARGAVQKHSADKIKSVVQEFYAKNFNELKEYQYSEKPIEINLGGNIIVNGKIDLVRTDSISKEIFIIDFKTSKRIPAEEIKTGQLDIYAVGYELLTGHKPDFIEIRSVDNNLKPAIKPVDSNTSKKVFKNIENAVSDIRSNCFKRITKDCENCRHKYLCQQYIKS